MYSGFLLVDLLKFPDSLVFRKAAYCMCEFNIQEIELFNYRQFEDKKFVLIYRDSTLRRFTDRLFAEAGFQPNILLETSNHQTIANLVSNGYACSIVPKMYISDTSKVVFYHLPGHPSWMLCGAYKKGSYLSQPKKDLLQMVTDYWTQK